MRENIIWTVGDMNFIWPDESEVCYIVRVVAQKLLQQIHFFGQGFVPSTGEEHLLILHSQRNGQIVKWNIFTFLISDLQLPSLQILTLISTSRLVFRVFFRINQEGKSSEEFLKACWIEEELLFQALFPGACLSFLLDYILYFNCWDLTELLSWAEKK